MQSHESYYLHKSVYSDKINIKPLSKVLVHIVKIVVTGPFASGKTTFIRTLCGSVLTTEKSLSSYFERKLKKTTTVALDFGVTYSMRKKLYLFGTPGQKRFWFMIPTLIKGTHGVLFLVDSSSRISIYRAIPLYLHIKKLLDDVPCLIAANKQDIPTSLSPNEVADIMGLVSTPLPLIALDKSSCLDILERLIHEVDS